MTLCRLLRSVRRYSSASNSFPFHPPFPTAAAQTPDYPPQNPPQYRPNSDYQYNNTHTPAAHSPQPPSPESSNYYQNPHFSSANTSNYQYNTPTPAAAADDYSNYHNPNPNPQYNRQIPTPEPSNYHQNPQYNRQIPTPEPSNYHQNTHYPSPNTSNFQYSHQVPAATNASNYQNPQLSTPSPTPNFQFPTPAAAPAATQRSYGFSSAEEAAAERRRRKRRLRIEPPLYALRPNPPASNPNPNPNPNDPPKPRQADNTTALTGARLSLHNRVQSLIRAGDLDSASYVARQSVFQYTRPTVFTCNAIIAAMYRAGRYNDAKALFQYFFRQCDIVPNIVSYNNLIVSHCESSEVDEALKVYKDILENAPYSPSSITYRHLTKGLVDAGRINDAVSMLHEMLQKGQGADSLVFNNVILGFLNLGNLEKANELFDELKERTTVYDGIVNATFMDWFFNQGKPKEAMESYRDLTSRNYIKVPATRNVLLETLLKHGKKKEAWDLFHEMLDDHTPPTFHAVNSDTVNLMVNECFKENNIEEAIDVFKRSGKGVKSRPFQMDVAGFNNMMARMCELEMMEEAEKYYNLLHDRALSFDVNTYKILIDAYIKVDNVENVLIKYWKMVEVGLRVIPPYANKWFGYLIEKGRTSDCLPILSKMADKDPKPDATTYDIVIRGLVDEGNFDGAVNLLRETTDLGVGSSVSLKEYVLGVFEGLGRRSEIENILNRFSGPFQQRSPYSGPQSSPRVEQGQRNPEMPWHSGSTDSSNQMPYGNNQFAEQTRRQPQMTEQLAQPHGMSDQGAEFHRVPQMTEQVVQPHGTPDQEAEFPRAAGQNAA